VHGAEGLVVSDDMLLSIALQACLPVLNIGSTPTPTGSASWSIRAIS
jgi:Mlc titration factor MtfA (ptsG expression regulator)